MSEADYNVDLNRFKKVLGWSILLHIALFAIPQILYFLGVLVQERSDMKIKVVQAAVRVDVVALPKHTLAELKNLQDVGSASEKAEIPEVTETTVADQENLIDFLKETSKKKVKKIEAKPEAGEKGKNKNLSKTLSKDLKNIILAGNKLSAGTALYGSNNSDDSNLSPEFRNYLSRLPDLVRPNWRLPSYLKDGSLRCRIRLFLKPSGDLVKAEIFESSSSKEYDERAMKAIIATAPFPILPEGSESHGRKGIIVLGFPL